MRSTVMLLLAASCSSSPPEDCSALASTAHTQIGLRVAKYLEGCSSDSDCVLLESSLSCYVGCKHVVAAAHRDEAASDLRTLDQFLCSTSQCEITAGCVEVFGRCMNDVCHAVEGTLPTSDAGPSDATAAEPITR
ncbi:MAG: hypothetical protein IPJ65_41910 [Archangiaceae bacterium]|nr:hypothetical protein [Archangiaceae bacterium]